MKLCFCSISQQWNSIITNAKKLPFTLSEFPMCSLLIRLGKMVSIHDAQGSQCVNIGRNRMTVCNYEYTTYLLTQSIDAVAKG